MVPIIPKTSSRPLRNHPETSSRPKQRTVPSSAAKWRDPCIVRSEISLASRMVALLFVFAVILTLSVRRGRTPAPLAPPIPPAPFRPKLRSAPAFRTPLTPIGCSIHAQFVVALVGLGNRASNPPSILQRCCWGASKTIGCWSGRLLLNASSIRAHREHRGDSAILSFLAGGPRFPLGYFPYPSQSTQSLTGSFQGSSFHRSLL
jgi:hypothetical protein